MGLKNNPASCHSYILYFICGKELLGVHGIDVKTADYDQLTRVEKRKHHRNNGLPFLLQFALASVA